jgi:hypothetical protein
LFYQVITLFIATNYVDVIFIFKHLFRFNPRPLYYVNRKRAAVACHASSGTPTVPGSLADFWPGNSVAMETK